MDKSLPRVASPLVALALALALLTGCSTATDEAALAAQEVALERYVAAGQSQIPAIMEFTGDMYSEVRILSVPPSTVEFAYYYSGPMDADAAAESLDRFAPTLQTLCDTQVFPEMESAGISIDRTVRYTYYNSDGSMVWTRDFTPS